ncbi:MAG: desulfoferrodoxin FeS4 iron-binding domain-containing protein [Bacillota bacterium]|nr:desulfoferrodoxin FeS4 iron-binding domain-containing protein [Bacillota bacterium]
MMLTHRVAVEIAAVKLDIPATVVERRYSMATRKEQEYKCQVCTNVVQVKEEGVGTLVCCNKPMELQSKK